MFETFSNWQTKHWININQLHVWPMPMTNAGVRNQMQWRNKNTQHLLWSRSKNCMRYAGLCLKLNLIPTYLFVLFVSKSRTHIHWTNNFAETPQRQLLRFYSFMSRGKHKDRHYNPWVAKKHVSCYGGFGSNYSVSSFWKFVNLSKCGNGTGQTRE